MAELPKPFAYCEFEGDYYAPWGDDWRDRPSRIHVIVFDDGAVFDTVNGWRHGADASCLSDVQCCIDAGHWRSGSFMRLRSAQRNIPMITMDLIKEALNPDG